MSDEPRDATPASTPNDPTGRHSGNDPEVPGQASTPDVPADGPADGSAPWERPRRWTAERMDATRVDDLLARLGSDEPATPRRRRRSDRAPIEHGTPAVPAETGSESPAAPESPEAVPTSVTLPPIPPITAPAAPVEPVAPAEPAADLAASTGDRVDPADLVPEHTPHAETGLPADQPEAVLPDETPTPLSSGTDDRGGADQADTDHTAAIELPTPEDITAGDNHGDIDPVTAGVPTYIFDDRTEVLPRIVNVPAEGEDADDVRSNLRASLVTDEGESAVEPAAADLHPRKKLMLAGRSVLAVFSALVLIYVGSYWVVLNNTKDAGRHIDAGLAPITAVKSPPTETTTRATTGAPEPVKPVVHYQQENFLIFGSDSRAGDNGDGANGGDDPEYDGVANSDTMMVAHISADRQQVSIVSLPRDLWIDDLTCETWDEANQRYTGSTREASPGGQLHLNSSYSIGGAKCLVDAVEQVTGLQITRFLGIGFAGFKGMVDALGGVKINACGPIEDLTLGTILANGGEQTINGDQALNLARARKVAGPVTDDLGRIRRQQILLSAILNQAKSADVLLNPVKLNTFVKSFFSDTIRDNVEVGDMLTLADSMGDLDPARVTFYTLPTFDAGDGRSLDLDTVNAGRLFDALRADEPVPGAVVVPPSTESSTTEASTTAASTRSSTSTTATTATPPPPPTLSVSPGDTQIRLVNAADRAGLSTETSAALNDLGFNITDEDLLRLGADETQTGITVKYASANLAAALTVASAVPGSVLAVDDSLGNRVDLVLGTSFDGTVQAVSVGEQVRADLAASVPSSSAGSTTTSTSTSASASSSTPSDTAGSTAAATSSEVTPTETLDVASVNAGEAGCM
ncbi:hypothetical protein D1871_04930 [Nakamurella silvestris]|nr:hypothetical protein D1871_04930 [Nakamurella silvestris]